MHVHSVQAAALLEKPVDLIVQRLFDKHVRPLREAEATSNTGSIHAAQTSVQRHKLASWFSKLAEEETANGGVNAALTKSLCNSLSAKLSPAYSETNWNPSDVAYDCIHMFICS